jgi:hypothetical protein
MMTGPGSKDATTPEAEQGDGAKYAAWTNYAADAELSGYARYAGHVD